MRWRLLLLLSTASLLCFQILIQHASNVRAQGTVVWSADHEEVGDADWYYPNDPNHGGGEYNSGCAGTSPGYQFGRNPSGSDMWPFSLVLMMASPCGDRSESGTRLFRWQEPRQYPDLYYKVWYYFPQIYTLTNPPNQWWNIWQWKSSTTSPARNDMFFGLFIWHRTDGNMYVYLHEPKPYDPINGRNYDQTLVDIPIGQWFYLEGYYESRGDASGRVTVWQGDEATRTLLWDLTGVQTRYPDSEGADTQWGVGNYGNGASPLPTYIAIDDAEIRLP